MVTMYRSSCDMHLGDLCIVWVCVRGGDYRTDFRWILFLVPCCALLCLQSCHMACDVVDETGVYLTTGNPLPADIESVINWLLNEPFITAFQSRFTETHSTAVTLLSSSLSLPAYVMSSHRVPAESM